MNRKNLFESRLASGIAAAATSFSVTTGEGQYAPASSFVVGVYPADYNSPSLAMKAGKHEWMIVGSRTTDAMSSVVRGVFGSTALDHNTAETEYVVYSPVLAQELIGINSIYKDTGGDDAYVITTGHSLTDTEMPYLDGLVLPMRVDTGNTGACVLALDSATSKAIKVVASGGVRDPLTGEIPADGIVLLEWSEDDDYYVLLNPAATAAGVGLENVDNTSDADKPVSTATQEAISANKSGLLTLFTTATVASGEGDRYWLPGQSDTAFTSAAQAGAPQFFAPCDLELSDFVAMFGANSIVNNFSVSIYVEGVISALTLTFANGDVLKSDYVTTVSVTRGQKVHFMRSAVSGGGQFTAQGFSVFAKAV